MSKYVGKAIPRYDGIGHVTGRTVFVDDIVFPGMLYIKVLRSPVHKGVIQNMDTSAAESMPGVAAVLTSKDIPGENAYYATNRSARACGEEYSIQRRANCSGCCGR